MDKYEYQVCTEQIKELIAAKRFTEAMQIADTIDWRRVRSVSMLITVSEIYKVNKRYEDAKDILLLAYERHPNGRDIVYALCELFIKLGDVVQAIESYKEFMAVAPGDANSYVLLYKIYKAQDVSLEEQIDVLEEYKRKDYREKWAYELASLYHKTGQEAKCIAECDELILWFGEGKYVRKAMELKMQHTALTKDQQAKFDGRAVTGAMPKFEQPGQDNNVNNQFGNNAQQTGPLIDKYGEYLQQTGAMGTTGALNTGSINGTGQIQNINDQVYGQQYDAYGNPIQAGYAQQYDAYGNPVQTGYGQYDAYGNPVQVTPGMYQNAGSPIQVTPEINHLGMTQDIMGQAFGTGVWSAVEMQNQLGTDIREAMDTYQDPYAQQSSYTGQMTGSYTGEMSNSQSMPQMTDSLMIQQMDGDQQEEAPIKAEPVKPAISVNTGIIDLSGADLIANPLPGDELPEDVEKTGDIMSQLDGIIPGTGIKDDEDAGIKDISQTGVSSNVNVHKTKSRITGQIPSFLPSSGEGRGEVTDGKPVEESYEIKEETPEEEISRISAISQKAFPGFDVPEITIDEEDKPVKQEAKIPDAFAYEEEKAQVVEETVEEVREEIKEEVQEEVVEEIKEEINDESPFEEDSELPRSIEKRITSELPKVDEKLTPVGDEVGKYPYDTVTDIGYVEELPEIDQPEDVDDILKTGKIPSSEIDAAIAYETDIIEEPDEYEVEDVDGADDDGPMPAFMRTDIRARREFDDDEYKIFCRYDGMENLKAQLVDAMDSMSMDAARGNIVIMGPESVDCKGIAINLVKAMQAKNPAFSGKVAKISGEALNKKNIKGTLEKLENGALVVERAGGLTQESVMLIAGTLADSDKPILVIFEGQRDSVRPLFKYSKLMKTVFDARIDIAEFSDDDLVNYGRGYALEKEYSIDEMGGLALHNRISEMQTFDHKVTTEDVKEFIDMAINHVDKKNMGHLMDMLLGRRYDDEDNIILSEKDFMF